jgi:molybdopterin biosynthesis enzyme
VGLFVVGVPSAPMSAALVMELIVTPLLCLWQSRIATPT